MAILMVMLFHFEATWDWFPGGSLGVDIFFVLSGFLITTLLLEERSRNGTISLPAFFRRRARRLLPALAAFLASFAAITIITTPSSTGGLLGTLIASAFYVFNWVLALGGQTTGGAGHIWSLSVEEQFYLSWPMILIAGLRAGPKVFLGLSVVVFVASASLPVWSGRSYEGLYYGTDFRAQALMAGAILAQLRFGGVINASIVERAAFRSVLALSIVILGGFLFGLHDREGFLFAGLYTVAAVASAVLVCALVYAPPRILAHGVIRYIGTRSYALYLWHHAIAFWIRDLGGFPELALSFGLSFAAAEASWQLVERRSGYLSTLLGWFRRRYVRIVPASQAASPS